MAGLLAGTAGNCGDIGIPGRDDIRRADIWVGFKLAQDIESEYFVSFGNGLLASYKEATFLPLSEAGCRYVSRFREDR